MIACILYVLISKIQIIKRMFNKIYLCLGCTVLFWKHLKYYNTE